MVPINRSEYNTSISKNEKLLAFSNLLNGSIIQLPDMANMPEADKVYFQAIQSIQNDNSAEFNNVYQILSKRNPTKDNPPPFVHNDFLIFTLLCGILKFNTDKTWIKNIVEVKTKNAITSTFENIVSGNVFNSTNLPEITISMMNIIGKSDYPEKYLNESYSKIVKYTEAHYSNDFLKLSVLSAFDIILLLKDVSGSGEYTSLKEFENRFLKRINILGIAVYNVTVGFILYGLIKLIALYPDVKEIFEKTGLILGVLGVGVLGSNLLPTARNWVKSVLLWVFGYKTTKKE